MWYIEICIELLILKCWWNIEFTWYILFCLSAGWLTTAASAYRNLLPSLGTFSQYDCLLLHVDISTLLLRRISQNVIKPIKWEKSISCESLSHSHSYFCCWCSCLCWCCFVVVIVIMHLRLFSSRFGWDSVGILLWYVLYIYVKLSGMYTHKYICVYFCCNTADAMRNWYLSHDLVVYGLLECRT